MTTKILHRDNLNGGDCLVCGEPYRVAGEDWVRTTGVEYDPQTKRLTYTRKGYGCLPLSEVGEGRSVAVAIETYPL